MTMTENGSRSAATGNVRGLFIDGAWRDAEDGAVQEVINPADGKPTAQVARSSIADLDTAVGSARRAFDEGPWRRMSGAQRGRVLYRVADLIERDAVELGDLVTREMGQAVRFTRQEAAGWAASIYRYYAGVAAHLDGATRSTSTSTLNYTLREPLGVVAAIPPFNLPMVLSNAKIAPALAGGNTVVHKPAETTPLSAIKIVELFAEAGLPDGTLNLITGPGVELGQALVAHPQVNVVTFTGSTAVGKAIARTAAETLKTVQMELGGKSANIVFADAYLDQAVQQAFFGIFYNTGQVCTAGSRLLVERPIYDQVVEQLVQQATAIQPGDPTHPETVVGPLAHRAQYERVRDYIRIGQEEGAELLVGGSPVTPEGTSGGFFLPPTIFGNVDNNMRIAREEIFGPVLSVIPFDTEDEALRLANNSLYGLASGVHTSDIRRGHRMAARLQAGTCWVNTYNQFDPAMPFGGYKDSGYGRDFGPEAMEAFLQTKSVWVDMSA